MYTVEQKYVIGLDLGGTNSIFGIVNARGEIKAQTAIKTQDYLTIDDYINASCEALQPIIDSVGGISSIKGMGIGAPSGNFYTGCIEHAANLKWEFVPITQLFHDRLNIPVSLANDANAAALGEMTYGAARGMKDFIMITLGTGVGSGIVVNRQLVLGCDSFAGELGHFIIDNSPEARPCGCGRKGCLETYCSATGVARTAREFLEKRNDASLLRELDPANITSLDIYNAAIKGDALAKDIFDSTGTILGKSCANFATFSSPEAFIFFGGLTKAGDLLMDPIKKAYDENILNMCKGKAQLLISSLNGSKAAVLGASALGWGDR